MQRVKRSLFLTVVLSTLCWTAFSQTHGSVSGRVVFGSEAKPLSGVSVRLAPSSRTVVTDDDGKYEFAGVDAGRYTVIAHLAGFEDVGRTVVLVGGRSRTVDISLQLTGVREQVTVTATGDKQAAFDAVQPTITVSSDQILGRGNVAIGEALNDQPGIAMRSAAPLTSRPVIRGFDGDRVLVANDGIRNGSISSLSENHAEPIDMYSVDRIEVVRGPATLLYGSNAFGGVVNAISRHAEDIDKGVRGYVVGMGGTNNGHAAVSGGMEYGRNDWGMWGSGSGHRTGNYMPGGDSDELENTFSRMAHTNGGAGYFGKKGFFTANYDYYRNRYGIPIEPDDPEEREETIAARRHNLRFNGGWRDLNGSVESVKLTFDYSNYTQRESEIFENDPASLRFTDFDNKVYSYRGVVGQKRHGYLSGTFGFDGYHRNYHIHGDETLIDGTVTQTMSSGFALEQIDLERITFLFGGRVEDSRYRPDELSLVNRDLTGFSGSVGMRVGTWEGGAIVANYSHATRLPDLEEFYNNGPHDDTVSFEIGDPYLKKEVNDGIDLSLRHQKKRLRAEANFYFYDVKNFVYLQPTGEIDPDTGLEIAEYVQRDSRFWGTEETIDLEAHRHFDIFGGLDYVRAHFTSGGDLPRIPPFRGRIGFDAHARGFSVRPELMMVHAQDHLFTDETRTPGYSIVNVSGSYVWLLKHIAHTIGVNAYNLTDKFYMNHVSFIKDFSPEIGRGVRFSYTMRFF